MIVKLTDDFFIDIDDLNYTLKQLYIRTTKNKERKTEEKIHGYYSCLNDVVEAFIKIKQLNSTTGVTDILRGYVKIIEDINNKTVQEILNYIDKN